MEKTIFCLAALALLAGCSLAPIYERPIAPVAASWSSGGASKSGPAAAGQRAVADVAWRDYFADERLRQVIALALLNNRDLRVSALNVEKARARYGIEHAAQLPKLSGALSESAGHRPGAAHGEGGIDHQYSGGLIVPSYELDFFGKLRSLSEAEMQRYLGTEEARRAQQISLVAEVANSYLTLIADQQRLALAADTLKSQQISYALSKRRFEAGTASGLAMYESQTSVETARNDMAAYTAQVAMDLNALTLLAGGALPAAWLPNGEFGAVTQLAAIPDDMPSAVLLRRPDVLEAERTLRAANANIGAARAAFFPSMSLTASGGSASGGLSGLFQPGSSTWNFLPQISLPIFDGGVNRANLNIAKMERDIALARYEKSIQGAFREVADALAQRGTLDERLASQQQLTQAAAKSFHIHEERYRKGAESYQNELVSQRALYAAQQGLISARLSMSSNAVTLYKVLGGGWQANSNS
ncbi:efflux transporter outer membrane subunit [Duganella violaceipulchra]|uniref:Efflux transporter outer membrane subunit n=1 Tax=Duganella violaceipulchra TaxID=2849652 RepID=A0AA41L5Q8_9BURK|nr:efflux transporter outer membrane subunit [Duganella violaceicalia]MBV6322497.1 efflux transporter outer membrane subunit [Duganella violaceicalia]MCP2010707.1 multidrug efflux system outer membrane protein [Duganella violaceicalia]